MWKPNKSDIITKEQRETEANEKIHNGFIEERNKLLAETDWLVIRKTETGEEIPKAWLKYRQELRDLPKNTEDVNNLVWPKKPKSI